MMEAVSPLLQASGIEMPAEDVAAITSAANDFAMLLLVAREAVGMDSASGERSLAEALDRRLRELQAKSTQLEEAGKQLAEAQSLVGQLTRERDGVAEAYGTYERAVDAVLAKLELAAFRNAGNPDETLAQQLLHGDLWPLRLVLLAAREAWSLGAAAVATELAALIRISEVPAHCSAALVAVDRIAALDAQPFHPIVIDTVEELCRVFDATARISELYRSYNLQELESLEPWARVVATAVRNCLAGRGVEFRRPPLLQPADSDFSDFHGKYGDEQMPSVPAIRKRIGEELEQGNDRFVIDVTQSEVVIGGVNRRIGVLSLVSPHRWRT
jgi:hypothetical protein